MLPTVSTATGTPIQAVIPTQEQLETLQQKQLEMLQLLEQQKQLIASSGGKPELFQFPIALWPISNNSLITSPSSTVTHTSSMSATPSPTPSLSSNDSGFQSISEVPQHRPLSGSQSAPQGLKDPLTNAQYESLLRQFQVQHQALLMQQQQLYQHYLDQQQRVMQQAVLEKKRFEEQQRQLAGMHLEQQQQLQRQQALLRQMQEQQLMQLQRQQQMLILQTLGLQKQHQAAVQNQTKQNARRVSNKSETLSLPYSPSSSGSHGNSMDVEGQPSPLPQSTNLSPSMLHRSLSANSSVDSVGSTNGRNSPNVVVSSPVALQVRSRESLSLFTFFIIGGTCDWRNWSCL